MHRQKLSNFWGAYQSGSSFFILLLPIYRDSVVALFTLKRTDTCTPDKTLNSANASLDRPFAFVTTSSTSPATPPETIALIMPSNQDTSGTFAEPNTTLPAASPNPPPVIVTVLPGLLIFYAKHTP